MKQYLAILEAINSACKDELTQRDHIFDATSDRWKISDNGTKYAKKTGELQEVHADLRDVIHKLRKYLK